MNQYMIVTIIVKVIITSWVSLFTCFLAQHQSWHCGGGKRNIKCRKAGISDGLGQQDTRHTYRNNIPGKCRAEDECMEFHVWACLSVHGEIWLSRQSIVAELRMPWALEVYPGVGLGEY